MFFWFLRTNGLVDESMMSMSEASPEHENHQSVGWAVGSSSCCIATYRRFSDVLSTLGFRVRDFLDDVRGHVCSISHRIHGGSMVYMLT